MANTYLTGPPVRVDHFKTTCTQNINGVASYRDNPILNAGDNGVFVQSGRSTTPVAESRSFTISQLGSTAHCLGGTINLDTSNATYTIGMFGTARGNWTNSNRTIHYYAIMANRGSLPGGTVMMPFLRDLNTLKCGIIATMSADSSKVVSNTVEKTEFLWTSTNNANTVGVTGFTFYSASGYNGGIRLPNSTGPFDTFDKYAANNNNATKSLIMCRIVPTEHEGLTYDGNKTLNNFVIFDGLCDFVLGSSDDTSAIGEPIAALVPSLTKSQVTSNTGMLAVAVMAKGTTKAYYLGNKNSVYKLYNGPDPYIMPPGSIVNIGKKQFQSIAYSSYYVKLN